MVDGDFSAGRLGSAPSAYYQGELAAGAHLGLDFQAPPKSRLRIVLHPEGGDVDMALRRTDGTLVDFSNYRGNATEFIEVPAAAGEYRLEIVAQSAVKGFDVTVEQAEPLVTMPRLSNAPPLDYEERLLVAATLEQAGYFSGSATEIALSAETIRAFVALQDSVGVPIDGAIDANTLAGILHR